MTHLTGAFCKPVQTPYSELAEHYKYCDALRHTEGLFVSARQRKENGAFDINRTLRSQGSALKTEQQ